KSGVWVHFKRLNSDEAECKLCPIDAKKRVFKTTKKSTSGLHNHLRSTHPMEYTIVSENKELTKKRERMCAEFLAENSTVCPTMFHSKTFLAFFPESEWSTFPSRTTLTDSIIPKMVAEIIEKNMKDLKGIPVTLVTDSWT
ncbi:hypothetical protein PMAYCL1PPCAC_05179, partial [Pristionchus mayeri]